jgi:hypothetical protein
MDAEVMRTCRCDGVDLSGDEAIGNLGSEICNELCETLPGDWFGEIRVRSLRFCFCRVLCQGVLSFLFPSGPCEHLKLQ